MSDLLSMESSPCPSHLPNLLELLSQKDTLVSLTSPGTDTPSAINSPTNKTAIWHMQELWSSFFSCYSNILKSLFLFCPLNSVLVAVFAPASALSPLLESMRSLSGPA